jgi:hypothetical protein
VPHSVKNSVVVDLSSILSSVEAKQVPDVALVDIVHDKLLTTVNESVVQRHSLVNSAESVAGLDLAARTDVHSHSRTTS